MSSLLESLKKNRERNKTERMAEKEERRRIDKGQKIILWVVAGIFFVYSLSLIFPFLWLAFNSLKTKQEFFNTPWAWPAKIMTENYLVIFEGFDLAEMFLNSLVLVVTLPLAGLFFTCCAAYATAKFNFKGRGLFYFIAVSVMFIPTSGSLAVVYKLMYDLKLIDSLLGMIVMNSGALGFNFLLIYGFFRNIPWSYAESAYMDGAGNFTVFLKIMLPQVRPMLLAILIMSVIGTWNDYMGPFLFYNSHQTVATGVKYISDNIQTGAFVLDYPKLFATIIITTLPIIILFISSQKFIIRINLGGGIKG